MPVRDLDAVLPPSIAAAARAGEPRRERHRRHRLERAGRRGRGRARRSCCSPATWRSCTTSAASSPRRASGSPRRSSCVNNDGGGIFSQLPVAAHREAVGFDALFTTPHGLDLSPRRARCSARASRAVGSWEELRLALKHALGAPGVSDRRDPVDRDADTAARRAARSPPPRAPRRAVSASRRAWSTSAARASRVDVAGRRSRAPAPARLHRLGRDACASWPTRCAPGFRTISVDLAGPRPLGRAPRPSRYALEVAAGDLARLLDALGEERAHVLGYSLGGRIALGFAALRPQRVRSALVDRRARPGSPTPPSARARVRADEALADELERDGLERFVDRWMALPLFASQARLGPELLAARARAAAAQPRARPRGVAARRRRGRAAAAPRALARLDVPILLRGRRRGREVRARSRASWPRSRTARPRRRSCPSAGPRRAARELRAAPIGAQLAHDRRFTSPQEIRAMSLPDWKTAHGYEDIRFEKADGHRQDHDQPARGAQRVPARDGARDASTRSRARATTPRSASCSSPARAPTRSARAATSACAATAATSARTACRG